MDTLSKLPLLCPKGKDDDESLPLAAINTSEISREELLMLGTSGFMMRLSGSNSERLRSTSQADSGDQSELDMASELLNQGIPLQASPLEKHRRQASFAPRQR